MNITVAYLCHYLPKMSFFLACKFAACGEGTEQCISIIRVWHFCVVCSLVYLAELPAFECTLIQHYYYPCSLLLCPLTSVILIHAILGDFHR